MAAGWHSRAFLVAALLLVSTAALSEPSREGPPWYVPDHATFQFAGSIGLFSGGPGWSFLDESVEAGLLLGWAPPLVAGEDFLTLTLKGQLHPFRLEWEGWSVRPLTVGMLFSYTFGDAYFVRLPDRYEDGYYWFKTGLRPALLLGAGAGRPVPALGLRLLEGYFELVATDYRIIHFLQDPGTVETGLFSLALGVRFRF
ncbi:hypothetical protein HPC49_06960 [Pyxidicoccus fallax]|uniref:Outer membrane protein beta-barrel domain-containing protein n=1 Tax=Pyxidicoccus fallax TaxID=394095 RepID=A0A848LF18_9BACT|nr:hypothetical protein [Pyxidicoccus fallax]NMO14108.1 hypothetical protein [Pyxidicoccus fallax]NPC77993.1 hypothetical protein [Pyxidicoccus fallax]